MQGSPERFDVPLPCWKDRPTEKHDPGQGKNSASVLWLVSEPPPSQENALSWVGCWPRGQRWLVGAGRRAEQVLLAEGDTKGQTDPAPGPGSGHSHRLSDLSVLIWKMEITKPSQGLC